MSRIIPLYYLVDNDGIYLDLDKAVSDIKNIVEKDRYNDIIRLKNYICEFEKLRNEYNSKVKNLQDEYDPRFKRILENMRKLNIEID